MKNARLINRLVPLWLLCYTGLTWAASLAQDMRSIDIESMGWACAAGVLGGALRTIVTLAGERMAVYNIKTEAMKDMVVALVAGLIAYIVIQGIGAFLNTYFNVANTPRDLRILIIIWAGWSRMGFFGKLDRLAKAAIGRAEKHINGGVEPPPSSETMPLE